jgi:hydroxymethylpyrimidine/phosphomethylpyrimidine kinase
MSKIEGSPAVALTIAGLDPSCGAGITADLKTFAAHRLYGICCPTALTVQSTRGVQQVVALDPALVAATLDCIAADIPAAGIKIGMLATAGVAAAVADYLETTSVPASMIVLDPVLRSTSGVALLDNEGIAILRERLLPRVGWIAPNLDELAVLLDEPVATAAEVPAQAARLQQMAARAGNPDLNIVVTGGHLDAPNDYFLDTQAENRRVPHSSRPYRDEWGEGCWIEGKRVHTSATHGTGCAFSSALLCQLIAGFDGREAVAQAKAYVTAALLHAFPIGSGKGPMHHLFQY